MINARTTAVALICMLAGCFSGPPVKIEHLDYPAYFPAPMPAASGCPDLTGRYRNADSGSKPRLLAELVLSRTTTPLDHIHLVEIDGPRQGGVVLRLVEGPVADDGSGGAEVGRRQWQPGSDYQCEDGWLVLSWTRFAPIPAAGSVNSVRFVPGRDGSLVVEQRGAAGGVLFFLPVYFSSNSWHLFRQVPDGVPGSAP